MENNIKINELRLGNYICVNNNGHPCRVMELTMSSVVVKSIKENYNEPTIKSFNPIPLTEEWLLKFGFEKFAEHTPSYGHDDIYRKSYIDINGRYNQYHFRNILIESVHQLQNLYFALTKEELTMK